MNVKVKIATVLLILTAVLVTGCDEGESGLTETPTFTPTPADCRLPLGGVIYPLDTATPIPDPNQPPTLTPTSTPTLAPGEASATPTSTPPATLDWCTPTATPPGGSGNPHPVPPPVNGGGSGGGTGGGTGGGSGGGTTPPLGGGMGAATNGTGVDSVTIDPGNQSIKAVAIGPEEFLIAWQDGQTIVVGSSDGAAQLTVYEIAKGNDAALAFSLNGRAHLAYEDSGVLYYRSALNRHVGSVESERVTVGENPQLAIAPDGSAVLFFTNSGKIMSMIRIGNGSWDHPRFVANADEFEIVTADDGSFFAAVKSGGDVRVYHQQGTNWAEKLSFSPAGLIGAPHIDVDGDWVYVSWVTEQPDPSPNDWPRRRPEYKGAMPFVNRVSSGANALV